MAEDRDGANSTRNNEPVEPASADHRRSTGVIFALVAIALILAIGFFYLTKDKDDDRSDAVIRAGESMDSAARVVGDAAQNAADRLRNGN